MTGLKMFNKCGALERCEKKASALLWRDLRFEDFLAFSTFHSFNPKSVLKSSQAGRASRASPNWWMITWTRSWWLTSLWLTRCLLLRLTKPSTSCTTEKGSVLLFNWRFYSVMLINSSHHRFLLCAFHSIRAVLTFWRAAWIPPEIFNH